MLRRQVLYPLSYGRSTRAPGSSNVAPEDFAVKHSPGFHRRLNRATKRVKGESFVAGHYNGREKRTGRRLAQSQPYMRAPAESPGTLIQVQLPSVPAMLPRPSRQR